MDAAGEPAKSQGTKPPEIPTRDLHWLQMSREMCSRTIICGTGSLPENLKIIASVAATRIYKRPARRESVCTVFSQSASGLEMLEQGREKEISFLPWRTLRGNSISGS